MTPEQRECMEAMPVWFTPGGTLPEGMPRGQLFGVAAAAGIGFTVSLFIADLAFDDPALVERAKVGIFVGSLLAGLLGWAVLSRARRV